MEGSRGSVRPLAFFCESLWPNTRFRALLLSIVAFSGCAFWLAAALRHPDVPLSVMAMFRNGGGASSDTQVYPLITSYLKVGERIVYESLGSNARSFRFASLLPHALSFALFGVYGFVLADAAVKLAYHGSLSALIKTLGIRSSLAESASLFVVANGHKLITAVAKAWGKEWFLFLGDMRLPRPFVADVFFFGALAFVLLPCVLDLDEITDASWVVCGVLLSALLQSDVHAFTVLALAVGIQFARGVLGVARKDRGRRTRMLKACVLLGGAFVVTCLPFALERAGEDPEMRGRLGVFPVARSAPLVSLQGFPFFGIATAVVVVTLAILVVCAARDRRLRARSILALWTVGVLATVALPVSCLVLGQAVQTYHFGIRLRVISSLLLVLSSAHAVECIMTYCNEHCGSRPLTSRLLGHAPWVGKVLVCTVCISFTALMSWRHAEAKGGDAFIALAKRLAGGVHTEWKVMGTLDPQVSWWWTSFAGGNAYVPDASLTTVSDAILEERFASFCREIGMSREEFREALSTWEAMVYWLGVLKYQAFKSYSIAPLADYAERDQAWIRQNTSDDCWRLALPRTAVARLMRTFDDAEPASDSSRRLDLIVLTKSGVMRKLGPAPAKYDLIYESDAYRIWERRERASPAQ